MSGSLPLVALLEHFKVLILPSSTELMMESLSVLPPVYNGCGFSPDFEFHYGPGVSASRSVGYSDLGDSGLEF